MEFDSEYPAENIKNPALRRAMNAVNSQKDPTAGRQFVVEFMKSTLLIPISVTLPDGHKLEEEPSTIPEGSKIGFRVLDTENGEPALPAFTDLDAMEASIPEGSGCTSLSATALIAMVVEKGFVELILNPHNEDCVILPRENLERFMQRYAEEQYSGEEENPVEDHPKPKETEIIDLSEIDTFVDERSGKRRFTIPQEALAAFQRLAQALSPAELRPLIGSIQQKVKDMEAVSQQGDLGPNMETVTELAKLSLFLIQRYKFLNEAQRALAIGAIRYFIEDEEHSPDATPFTGLDDDIQVMNHVLEELGINDKFITFG